MSSTVQLDLFAQQPQLIRYELSGTNSNRFTVDNMSQFAHELDQVGLVNDRGQSLISLPIRRTRSVSEKTHRRVLLETAFSQGRALAGLKLSGLKLENVHLAGTKRMDLAKATLTNAIFTGGRLWADLQQSTFTALVVTQADWHGCLLPDCQLAGARFLGSTLHSVNFRRSILSKANLQQCQLWMSDLSFCQLQQAKFTGSDLSGCDLRHANLTGCDFRGTVLRGISTTVFDLEKANLRPIRQRVQDLVMAYPSLKPVWVASLEAGHWQAGSAVSLSDFLSQCLGCRVGAGWQNVPGSTEWIIWQFVRSIQSGERPDSHPLAHLLYKWL